MPRHSTLTLHALRFTLCAAALSAVGLARADKNPSDGVFRDRAGAQHSWKIERSHTLIWDDKPYAPGGVVFRSAFLEDPSEATFQQDAAELERLKGMGISDLWIEPGRGLMETSAADTQKLIDAVEAAGFAYGLRIGDRSREPLIGFSPSVAPVRVASEELKPGGKPSWAVRVPGARRAVYALVECLPDGKTHHSAIGTGEVVVEQDTAQIQVQLNGSKLLGKSRGLLMVTPEVQVEPEELGSYGDLWGGMDAYSTRLRKYLRTLKFGPGLRFLMDPFASGDGTVGSEDGVFPSSEGFRSAFRDWLSHRSGIGTLNINWRMGDSRIPGMEEASRCIPMWPRNDPPDGDGWLFDPVDRVAYRCTPRQSSIWTDLDTFRGVCLKRLMNQVADAVKHDGPDVPVIFSWGAYHPLFTNSAAAAGYDGLGAQLSGGPAEIGRSSAGYVLAQAEEGSRNTWLVASRLSGPVGSDGRVAPITDLDQLRGIWNAVRDAGFRGAYLDPRHVPEVGPMAKGLAGFVAADAPELSKPVRVCFFPMTLAGADRAARLSNGVWWLPSGAPARLLRYGDSIMGYDILRPLGDEQPPEQATVLWSMSGAQEVSFYIDKDKPVLFYDSLGTPLKIKAKKGVVRLPLTGEPVLATGIDTTEIFPVELAAAEIKEMEALLKQAELLKLDVASLKTLCEQASHQLTPATAATVYSSLQPQLNLLREQLTPYVWIEGERSVGQNFSGIAFQTGCAAGTYLKLDRADAPRSGVYKARYKFSVRRDGSYELWVAGRIPGRNGASPLIWRIDDEPAAELKAAAPAGEDYTREMGWFMLGRVPLSPGQHELEFVVAEKGAGQARFVAGIDAVVISRDAFKPNGCEKPGFTPPVLPRADDQRVARKADAEK